MTLCNTCSKANKSCPIWPQETQQCAEYAGPRAPELHQKALARIGNKVHNLSCHIAALDSEIASDMRDVASELWGLSRRENCAPCTKVNSQ